MIRQALAPFARIKVGCQKVAKKFLTSAPGCCLLEAFEMKTAIERMQKPMCVGGYASHWTRHSLCSGIAGLSS
jgi:hypothetical protein